jgi:hypothetical protein
MPRVIEMRSYWTKAGRRDEFLKVFREKVAPAHEVIGMRIVGPFLAVDDPDAFFWMRGFPDAAVRDAMKSAFYDSPLWKEDLEKTLFPLLDRYESVLVEDEQGILERRS